MYVYACDVRMYTHVHVMLMCMRPDMRITWYMQLTSDPQARSTPRWATCYDRSDTCDISRLSYLRRVLRLCGHRLHLRDTMVALPTW